jgi:Periplasmic binding protein
LHFAVAGRRGAPRRRGNVVRARAGSHPSVRFFAGSVALLLLVAACGGGDDDDSTAAPTGTGSSDQTSGPSGEVTALEVDRTSRFSKLDTFCEPASAPESAAPKATGPGITANSISITHIRVTLEDLEGLGFAIPIGDPADQVEKFVGLVNDRCGGVNGRKLDLSLVEAPPLAPEGQDPNAVAQAACISATEDHKAVFAFSGSGWGGQGGAGCVTDAHNTIFLTTYNITQEDIKNAGNRLYSLALSSAKGLEYLARTLDKQGAFDGKTVGIVMQDSPGDPDIVEQGLINTLDDLGVEVKRVDTIGCGGGNLCNTGVIESVQGMIADGVNVLFPLLNVINLPAYIEEMVTQGVKPGQVQFYQSGYNAQNGDLVSSKVVTFGGPDAGKLYNGTEIVASGATGAFRLPGFTPNKFSEMCNKEYQAAGGPTYTASDPNTNSAYGATTGSCTFIRLIARAVEAAGPNPTRTELAKAMEGLGAIDTGAEIPGSFAKGKYTAPNSLNKMTYHYPCDPSQKPYDGICILPDGKAFPIPTGK